MYELFIGFMAIPIIAYFDYLLFKSANFYLQKEDGSYIKADKDAWYVATFIEVSLFLAGIACGFSMG